MLNDYWKELVVRDIKVSWEDFNIDNFLIMLWQYYKGGCYDFLLNLNENIDLLYKWFIVFEIDVVKDNVELFFVVMIIIMEVFINKLCCLKGVWKMLICEEVWKVFFLLSMSEYLKYFYKIVRKYFGEVIVVMQEVDDIILFFIVKEVIIINLDCKIFLDQKKYMNKFDGIQLMFGLMDKEKLQIFFINFVNYFGWKYKEVWIGLNGVQLVVYVMEVLVVEYLIYIIEESEKIEVFVLVEELGGDLEFVIKWLVEMKYK